MTDEEIEVVPDPNRDGQTRSLRILERRAHDIRRSIVSHVGDSEGEFRIALECDAAETGQRRDAGRSRRSDDDASGVGIAARRDEDADIAAGSCALERCESAKAFSGSLLVDVDLDSARVSQVARQGSRASDRDRLA